MEESDAYRIVQNPRRRALLTVLKELGGEGSLREVVWRMARIEGGEGCDKKLAKSIQVSLLQTHLPKMNEAGLIEYDDLNGTLRLLECPPEIKHHLRAVENVNINWATCYFILSAAGFLLSLVFWNLFTGILSACFLTTSVFQQVQIRHGLMIRRSNFRLRALVGQ